MTKSPSLTLLSQPQKKIIQEHYYEEEKNIEIFTSPTLDKLIMDESVISHILA